MREFVLTQGDTLPAIVADLTDSNGNPLDLTTAEAVTFSMILEDGSSTPISGAAATVVGSATDGRVKYQWDVGDTDVVGRHRAQFRVSFPTANPVSFPNDGYIYVEIIPKVGS